MADMASTMTEPMNSRLKKDYAAKANNLGSYYNQLYGKDNSAALLQSCKTGYGSVTPELADIRLGEPEIIKSGNKYGVKLTAQAPSIHLIKANITTEIAPIVGSEEQAKDLIAYIHQDEEKQDDIWDVNIFGKTVRQLVEDGLSAKINRITQESQQKLQDTMEKIVNDSNGGMVCIII